MANLLTQSTDLTDLREMFVKWDINQDGFISIQELNANMQEVTNYFQLDAPDIIKMMRAADTNGDG